MQTVGRKILDDDALELVELVGFLAVVLRVGVDVVGWVRCAVHELLHIGEDVSLLILHV